MYHSKLFHTTSPTFKCGAEVAAGAITGGAGLIGSLFGAGSSSASTADTNATNLAIAEQTNALNHQMMQEQNQFNAQQAEINRNFQSQEAEKARQYNSIGAQLQRAEDAGINPAFVLGSAGTPVSSLPSGSQASSGGIAPAVAPQMQSNANALSSIFPQIGTQLADTILKTAQAKKTNEETKSQMSYNKFAEDIFKQGLKLSEAQMHQAYANVSVLNEKKQEIQANVKQIQTITDGLSLDNQIKAVDLFYKDERVQLELKNLQQAINASEQQMEYIKAKMPYEIGILKAQAQTEKSKQALNYASADNQSAQASYTRHSEVLIDANKANIEANTDYTKHNEELIDYDKRLKSASEKLTDAERRKADSYVEFIKTENKAAIFKLNQDQKWDDFERGSKVASDVTGSIKNITGAAKDVVSILK